MRRKSVVLLSVVMILLTVALIGATLAVFFSSVNIGARGVADGTKALYIAEAGIAYAINILRSQGESVTQLRKEIGPVSLGEGSFSVKLNLAQSLITSTGDVRGTKRTIQLQYSAL